MNSSTSLLSKFWLSDKGPERDQEVILQEQTVFVGMIPTKGRDDLKVL